MRGEALLARAPAGRAVRRDAGHVRRASRTRSRPGVQSTRALVVNAALLAGWLLLSLVVLPRCCKSPVWRSVLLTVVACAAIVVLVVPTLRDTEVVEEFPAAVGAPTRPSSTTPDPTGPGSTTPTARRPTAPRRPVQVSIPASCAASATTPPAPRRSTARADGIAVVALEAIDIEPGPDYRVVVVRGARPARARATVSSSTPCAGTRARSTTRCHPAPTPAPDGRCSSGAGPSVCPSPTPARQPAENRRATCSSR